MEIFPPVIPSIALARNNRTNGTIIIIVPRKLRSMVKDFSAGKNKAKRNSIHPTEVPTLLNRRTFFRP